LPYNEFNDNFVLCRLFTKEIETNKEQLTAIQHIVKGTSRPAPYLIFGPPGTGKTTTLVEAIKQVYLLLFCRYIILTVIKK